MDSNTMGQSVVGSEQHKVVATLVPEAEREHFLYRQLGRSFLSFELSAYHYLELASEDYHGAVWDFYWLSNGGFYMAPRLPGCLRLCCFGNGFEGALSADAAGIYACAMAFSQLSFQVRDEELGRYFHLLRDFYAEHVEAAALFRALD